MNANAGTTLPDRISPLHDALEHLRPRWGSHQGMPVAVSLPAGAGAMPGGEAERAARLGLADLSALRRVTLKGPGALGLLEELGVTPPKEILGVAALQGGGIVARTGGSEFFVEDPPTPGSIAAPGTAEKAAGTVATILEATGPLGGRRAGVVPVLRADACILVSGSRAAEALAQTCGVELAAAGTDRLIYSRVAGVSCSILPRELQNFRAFQLWMDGTYGLSLWESLVEICGELGGGPVGWSAVFPAHAPTL